MPSGIRPQDAVALYNIFTDPGKGGDNLLDLVNILDKCIGGSSDSSGKGGHTGGNRYITPTGGAKTQLFSYTTKSYTTEKVGEALNTLQPIVAQLPDENLQRVVQNIIDGTVPTAASFVARA